VIERAYIALGANLGSDQAIRRRFEAAANAIAGWPEVRAVRMSRLYRSAAVGPVPGQPDYLNAVVEAMTELEAAMAPVELLHRLRLLEDALGRDRAAHAHQHPRPIDLDLIALGGVVADFAGPPRTIVPHPRAHLRSFVVTPLAELTGDDYVLPGQRESVGALRARLGATEQAPDIAAVAIEDDQAHGDAQGDLGIAAPEPEQ
jgi:2-amino-4-hydroxy-6-hydroxymethyldihydropteridine diphosphokinase